MALPVDVTTEQLQYLLNEHILKNVRTFWKNSEKYVHLLELKSRHLEMYSPFQDIFFWFSRMNHCPIRFMLKKKK
jgi:hypothetical protein